MAQLSPILLAQRARERICRNYPSMAAAMNGYVPQIDSIIADVIREWDRHQSQQPDVLPFPGASKPGEA